MTNPKLADGQSNAQNEHTQGEIQSKNLLSAFLKITFPPAEPLIKGLLNRRELCGFIGRRRHGKTTLLLNLGLSLAGGRREFIRYPIPEKGCVVGFFLEDDAAELQEKLKMMVGDGPVPDSFFIYTGDDFSDRGIPTYVSDPNFGLFVDSECEKIKPDVILLDNLSVLVRGEYNDPEQIDKVINLTRVLRKKYNCAVVIAAHPRKRGKKAEDKASVNLEFDPEGFFEECMGSSHFINSAGTLWGIERVRAKEKTIFVGGTQRRDGSQNVTPLEMRDGWFHPAEDIRIRLKAVLNTEARQRAWAALPNQGSFTRAEAQKIVKPHLKHSSYYEWWEMLVQTGALLSGGTEKFQKHPALG